MRATEEDREILDGETLQQTVLDGMGILVSRGIHRSERSNELTVHQHSEDIESLKKQINQKDEEIADLRKAMKDLEERNEDLSVTLWVRNEEIKTLKTRIRRLESEKKQLEDELTTVKVKLDRVEKDMKELREANMVHEERDLKMRENYDRVSGKMESIKGQLQKTTDENQALKREVKELKETQQKVVPPVVQQIMAPPKADLQVQASLLLGQLCRQLQIQLYKKVFPNDFSPSRNYKLKNIRIDLEGLPQPEEEKEKCKKRWAALKEKFTLDEASEEAMKALQDIRDIDAHPSVLTVEALQKSAEIMERKGNLKGWLSMERVKTLIEMWKQLSMKV